MSRKNHAAGAGGGKEKGRSAGDQQTGGATGGKLGGSGLGRGQTDVSGRTGEAGRKGGEQGRAADRTHRQLTDDTSGE